MNPLPVTSRQFLVTAVIAGLAIGVAQSCAQPASAEPGTNQVRIAAIEGKAEVDGFAAVFVPRGLKRQAQ